MKLLVLKDDRASELFVDGRERPEDWGPISPKPLTNVNLFPRQLFPIRCFPYQEVVSDLG
jgi:hypothetical protein